MKVRDVMSRSIEKIDSLQSVSKAGKEMDSKSIGSLLVEDRGKIVGIITERDILKMVAHDKDPTLTSVRDVMSRDLIKIEADSELEEASDIMNRNHVRRIVVEEKGDVIGIMTVRDVNKNLKYLIGKRIMERFSKYKDNPGNSP